MTIGERLKKTRISLGLTQAEMSAGIVTESYYSRVERGINEINIIKLLEILNCHQVSLFDFFSVFEDSENQITIDKIILAFTDRNVEELERIEKNLNPEHSKAKIEIQLMIAYLTETINKIPEKIKKEMKHNIFQIGEWNERNIWEFSIVMPLYEFDEIKILMASVLDSCRYIDMNNNRLLFVVANTAVNYLSLCYQVQQDDEIVHVGSFIKKLPINSAITIQKIIAQFYLKLIEDKKEARKIIDILKDIGYGNYVKNLDRLCE